MRILLTIALVFLSVNTFASLGGDESSIRAASDALGASTSATKHAEHYTLHETALRKFQIHEYVGANGKVFAVAWGGRAFADPAIMMGEHIADFRAALAKAKLTHFGHGPITVEHNGIHLELAGNGTSLMGRAWLIKDLPIGMSANEIR